MARARRKADNPFITGLAFLFVITAIGNAIKGYWESLSSDLQLAILIIGPISVMAMIGIFVYLVWRRKNQRNKAWHRAMTRRGQSRLENAIPNTQSARSFSPNHLEKFAAQVFKQMGYRVVHTGQSGDHGVDVHLINPNGQVELVQCKQWSKPVGEPEVRDLAGAMVHAHAVCGYIFAPGGFSQKAMNWAKGKNIILADDHEIGRLVESAYGE